MKVLIVGQGHLPWIESACADALGDLGCQVAQFGYSKAFVSSASRPDEPADASLFARLQNRLIQGPRVWRVNKDFIELARCEQPGIIWFYNCTHIFPSTVRRIRKIAPGAVLVQYANDDPFSKMASALHWRHFRRSVREFDIHLVYRDSNRYDFAAAGATKIHKLRPYYIPSEDYHVELGPEDSRFRCDVVFAGHYEPDDRVDLLEGIIQAGHRLNLFGGPNWRRAKRRLQPSSPLLPLFPVNSAVGDDYRLALCGAKIALCFLSTLNRDVYTRRNFQIPAMRVFMLSQYTEELASLFREGQEAEYFRNKEEMLDKIRFYLRHPSERERIAGNGHKRVIAGKHDVRSRMLCMLHDIARSLPANHPTTEGIRSLGNPAVSI